MKTTENPISNYYEVIKDIKIGEITPKEKVTQTLRVCLWQCMEKYVALKDHLGEDRYRSLILFGEFMGLRRGLSEVDDDTFCAGLYLNVEGYNAIQSGRSTQPTT